MVKKSLPAFLLMVLVLLLSACSQGAPVAKKRYFFPPPPVEPKIEYIKAYFSDYDLKPKKQNLLVKYVLGENRPMAIFTTPVDVASDGMGKVFVADSGARQVFILDLVRHDFRTLSAGPKRSFGVPYGVALAEDGRLYVCDLASNKVDVFDEKEEYLFSISDPGLVRPTAVAVDSLNSIVYVMDTANHRLIKFDLQGNLTGYLGARGTDNGQFNYPTDVDVDDQGNVYVLDSLNARVQVFDVTGKFLRMFGERGTAEGSFEIPKNLAVGNVDQVYVTDALAHKMVVFSSQGELLLRIGGKSVAKKGIAPGGFYLPRGVDVDVSGGIWVADTLNRVVHNFQYLNPQYLNRNPID